MSSFKSDILVMTVTIHYPKCKYCHLIFLLERTLLKVIHFSLDGHLLLLSLIVEREGEGSREGERKKERETRAFFSVAFWLVPYTTKVRDGK